MRYVTALGFAVLLPTLAFAQTKTPTPPTGSMKPGTMTNEKLRQDASVGVIGALAGRGCKNAGDFTPYVAKLPAGKVGARRWEEVWVVKCSNGEFPIRLQFMEDGTRGVTWAIPGKATN